MIGAMSEAICFMLKETTDYDGLDKKTRKKMILSLTGDLSYYIDDLKELKKPN